ncbi:MAG: hypothetical protein Q4C56_03315 [Peptococcaceae bacterium]|nr:hypothetical protein [Peptococcaceae bacterium]
MATKKSRTGKKKRPQYGPQGKKTNEAPQMSAEELNNYKQARRANYAAIGLLLVAMVLLLVSPNSLGGTVAQSIVVIIAYAVTIVAGALILYTKKYVVPGREKMTGITGWVMVGVGICGLLLTAYGLFGMA